MGIVPFLQGVYGRRKYKLPDGGETEDIAEAFDAFVSKRELDEKLKKKKARRKLARERLKKKIANFRPPKAETPTRHFIPTPRLTDIQSEV